MKFLEKPVLLFILFILIGNGLNAQIISQTIRGTIVDKVSQTPISGVSVEVLGSSIIKPVVSDLEGKFIIQDVPVGKQSLLFLYDGYKEVVMQNLTVNSGKELVLSVNMEEDVSKIEEVVIKAKVEKNKPLNEMSTVSTRTFSVEETQKFAAAVNDPARMASSFAGVVSSDDGNNTISIRGNSPNGLLWRMEGVEIPNPNHFSNVGTSGGGISILSAQLMSNSDFSTGAFAAEYGNALSGVFDLRLRKGNNQKREYTAQIGLLGIDIAAEGPFKKGYDGSYLINYRYSTLSVLGKVGVPLGDAVTNFQDLSFNISLPTQKIGDFTIFGFGGISDQSLQAKKDSSLWEIDIYHRYQTKFFSNTGAVGATNMKRFNNHSYIKTALVFSGTQNGEDIKLMDHNYTNFSTLYQQNFYQNKMTLSSTYTQKISKKSSLRSGIILNQLGYNLFQKEQDENGELAEKINVKGGTQTIQGFFQWQHKINSNLTSNVGLHYFQLLLNNSYSIEPRVSFKYKMGERNNFSLGYGLHSQLQPIGVYFAKKYNADINEFETPNRNLDLSKSHHLVLGYDFTINEYSHVKLEGYYQHLFSVPISRDSNNTYCILNALDGYNTDPLENNGLGRNYGIELTYERFLHKNFYYLLSGSLYDSKYKASNGNWYDTRFNTNYALVLTLGKEWNLKGNKDRVIGFNIKSIFVGGFRYTPIDLEASIQKGETVVDQTKTYQNQNPDYYRLDLRFSLKRNYKHLTSTFAIDIQNTTNRKNVGGQYFEANTGKVKYWYQTPLIPIVSYRLEF